MTKQETIQSVSQGQGIVAAIAKAMGEVKRLAKDNRNTEQKYQFASVDDFLAMTGPICAANGLLVMMDEDGCQEIERQGKYGPSYWLRFTYVITVWHSSGESLPPVRRSVEVVRTGAQSSGSAQSYALKQFLRAMLQIPTGDADEADLNSFAAAAAGAREPNAMSTPATAAAEGIRDAWRNAVLDSLPENATEAQKAEAFADAIIADFKGKGAKALDNAWNRHERLIQSLEQRYPALFGNVAAAYNAEQERIGMESEPSRRVE
jgi:hypothetical protein